MREPQGLRPMMVLFDEDHVARRIRVAIIPIIGNDIDPFLGGPGHVGAEAGIVRGGGAGRPHGGTRVSARVHQRRRAKWQYSGGAGRFEGSTSPSVSQFRPTELTHLKTSIHSHASDPRIDLFNCFALFLSTAWRFRCLQPHCSEQ